MSAARAARLAQLVTTVYGNPDSLHLPGQSARARLQEARGQAAAALGARPSELVFTSGATEANVTALAALGGAHAPRVVIGATEHPSVRQTALALAARGWLTPVELAVGPEGAHDLEALRRALREGASAVVAMAANNETGVLTEVGAIAALAAEHGASWHCDAVQALGWVGACPPGATSASFSGHKIGGPHGSGALVWRGGSGFAPLLTGGSQEGGRRAGTPNVPGALVFAEAAAAATARAQDSSAGSAVARLRDTLEAEITQRFPGSLANGAGAGRLPNTLSLCLRGRDGAWVDGEWVVLALAELGVAISTGAACSTGSGRPSHVLTAMGRSAEQAGASLRFTLGPAATADDIGRALEALEEVAG